MIVLSYPRSGSDYLCESINQFQKVHFGQSINLNEFTHLGSFGAWRNIFLQKNNLIEGKNTKIVSLTLKDNLNYNVDNINDVFSEVILNVNSKEQVDTFIKNEQKKRIDFLKKLYSENIKFVMKDFPEYIQVLSTDISEILEKQDKMILYRKNLKDCILSGRIKHLHYDGKIKKDLKDGNELSEIGHNFSNNPAPKIYTPLTLTDEPIRHRVRNFCQLLTIYRDCDNIPIISYEDMFDGKTISISGIEMSPKDITEKYVKKPELKMDYSLTGNKEDFFTNPEIISEIIEEEINNLGLKNIAKELGVHW